MESTRLYQKIADEIKQKIRDNTYPIGHQLPPERDFAAQLGVSRTSVREAIIALEVSGWVDVKVGSGVYVKWPDQSKTGHTEPQVHPKLLPYLTQGDEITPFELLQARLLLEPEFAALAAQNRSDELMQEIKDAYIMNVSDNLNASTEHIGDRLFHIKIAEASGNPAYAFFIRYLLGKQYTELFGRLQTLYTPEDMPLRSQLEHHQILMAIEHKRPEQARLAMQTHLNSVIEIFSRSVDA